MSLAWPIEEVLFRPLLTLLLAALVPIATGRVLAFLLLPKTLPEAPFEAARIVAPFRRAATVVGLVQLSIAWWLGWTALGPAIVDVPSGDVSHAFAWLTVVVALMGGAVGRLAERRGSTFADARSAMLLRLRLLPLVLGPVVAARMVELLPLVDASGRLVWPWAIVGIVVVAIGVAYGGLALAVVTGAVRPAPPELAARIRRAAEREGVRLFLSLRLPTGRSRFSNAAAIPWARTVLVSDRAVETMSPAALDAVLAHEAAHLSEGPRVALLRLSAATVLIAGSALATRAASPSALGVIVLSALVLLVVARRVARRMEERADAHAKEHVGGAALADALLDLQRENLQPLTTGSTRRVHPDLYDRIAACGRDLGERPAPPPSYGTWAGLAVASVLVAFVYGTSSFTEITADDIATTSGAGARRRQRVDPWDAHAMLALAWDASRDERFDEAQARIDAAVNLGAPVPETFEARAELAAARGNCEEARALFDEGIRARSVAAFDDPFAPLELGGWHLPPSLVSECHESVEGVAPGPDPYEHLELE